MSLLDESLWTGRIRLDDWRPGRGGTTKVTNPSTGAAIAEIGLATTEDVYDAARTAATAQRSWAATAPSERAEILRRAGQAFREHADELIGWGIHEAGSIPDKAAMEVFGSAGECFEAAALPTHPHGEYLPSDHAHWSLARAATVDAPEVRVVSFTGSTAAGRHVGRAGAEHLKRTHLELGGNNALIVLPGADVDLAAGVGAMGSFFHQGQICMTTGRHLVHESLYDEYVAALAAKADALVVGDPAAGPVHLGPIIDDTQLANIDRIVRDTVAAGGTLAAGGTHEGLFYRPTVLGGLTPDMPAWSQEIFGPVAPVLSFSTVDEAVALTNASEYGLSVSIVGEVGQAMPIADRVNTGKVHINEMTVADEANAPFGGVGASGTGSRFGGPAANIEAFTETQWVTVRPDIAPYPF
ncbi:aldehyde dehydrogenase family protein [Rhodococcus sp. Z13]|uniref:Aldehyde dehydrogenase family protein n=1 Tax=Rhodococcus sacchari TaxID=2962047 RepID=A0ACD4DIY2_9NOCA|nr:aldehyde dehydrogenase family protein [Rhodococcus sp. Z13]UYP19988.1 aldehyde dehydrogenase family protein [Rhodococcus sp. Z13]